MISYLNETPLDELESCLIAGQAKDRRCRWSARLAAATATASPMSGAKRLYRRDFMSAEALSVSGVACRRFIACEGKNGRYR